MNRVSLILVAALAVGLAVPGALAQKNKDIRRIGFLSTYGETDQGSQGWHKSFRKGLSDHGWIVGRNISIDYRWVRGRRECQVQGRRACLPKLVDELFARKVELIVVHGGLPARIVQRKNPALPVVMAEASDAVGRGIVKSLARPGGSITGLTSITPVLATKRLELLKAVVPDLTRVVVLWTREAPASANDWKRMQEPARKMGLALQSLELRRTEDPGVAFAAAGRTGARALISTSGVAASFGVKRLTRLVLETRLPAIFTDVVHTKYGGLLSYNRDNNDLYRRAAAYDDKILKGAKPAELPVEQPTRFYLTVNLKTAKALGITIPRSILLRADEVIE